jgi:hypothetical protein
MDQEPVAMGLALSAMMGPAVVGGEGDDSDASAPTEGRRNLRISAATIIRTVAVKDGAGPF